MIFVEMIFVSFAASFEDLICSWEKKHLQRKYSFPEMVGNHFFQGNAPQPPNIVLIFKTDKTFFDIYRFPPYPTFGNRYVFNLFSLMIFPGKTIENDFWNSACF